MATELHPELERRIRELESTADQESDFDTKTWLWLIVLGIVVPIVAVVWGVS